MSSKKKKKQPIRRKHVPQRTCFVCREKGDKRQLVRLVRTPEGPVLVDPTGKQNGRGAYLCDDPACWDKVLRDNRLLNQALKTTVTTEMLTTIAAHRPEASSSKKPQENRHTG